MKVLISKIVRFRYILAAIILGTILFLIFHPNYMYANGEYLKAEKTVINRAKQYTLLSEKSDFDICYIVEGGGDYFNFNFVNFETGDLKQFEQRGFSVYSSIRDTSGKCYYDNESGNVYTIGTKNRADYYLFESNGTKSRRYKLLHHDFYDSLCDSIIVVNQVKFYSYNISDTIKDNLLVKSYKDGYKIILNRETHEIIHEPSKYNEICKILSQKISTNL